MNLGFFFCFLLFAHAQYPIRLKETSEFDGGVLVEGVVRLFVVYFPGNESIVVVHTFYSSSLTPFSSQPKVSRGPAYESRCCISPIV